MSVPQPIFILTSPYSYSSVISTMLGQHPKTYSVPELNLLIGDKISEVYDSQPPNGLQGLMRTIAQLYTGEQTVESIEAARRWFYLRTNRPTKDIYVELCQKISPLRMIDKSTVYTDPNRSGIFERMHAYFPQANYLHLVRHPRTQCQSWLRSPEALSNLIDLESVERLAKQTVIDPQLDWLRRNQAIVEFLKTIPEDKKMRVCGEDLISDPKPHLQNICSWLQLDKSESSLEAMLHPENSSYSCMGPYGSDGGSNQSFQVSPELRLQSDIPAELEGRLPWRADSKPFKPELVELAQQFGYS